ncbi:MAG: response regulator transcription factor [Cytophagales bacterium]|nr:response regulator transcription factor [Cytophagales bacterium]
MGLNVLYADAQTLARIGMKNLLMATEGVESVSVVSNSNELELSLEAQSFDILVIDYHQEGVFSADTIFVLKKRYPELQVLAISDDKLESRVLQILESGVNGFVTRSCSEGEIKRAVLAVAKGEKLFCDKVLNIILHKSFSKEENCESSNLTNREIEITKLISEGMTNKEIATKLFISHHTVHTHRKNIMKKLGVSTASELTIYAINTGIITL